MTIGGSGIQQVADIITNSFILLRNILWNKYKGKYLYRCKSLWCLLMWAALSGVSVSETGVWRNRPPPHAEPHAAAWKATSISAQTSAVTQIRQPQCSGLLSPPTGGGQPDLRRMETFSPRNGQNQLLPSSINATPSLSAPRIPL